MILLIYLICFISVFYIIFFAEKVKNKNSEQSKKETEELKTEEEFNQVFELLEVNKILKWI